MLLAILAAALAAQPVHSTHGLLDALGTLGGSVGFAMIITPSTLDAAFLEIDTLFQRVFRGTTPKWPLYAMELKSTTETEIHAWLKRIPELRKWVGERRINNLSANVQTIVNELFEDTVGVERTKLEDDKLNIYGVGISDLAEASARWPDKITVDALRNGKNVKCHDGQPFYDKDHPVNPDDPASAVQPNLFTATALTYDNVRAVRANGMALLDESGVPLELNYDTIFTGPDLETAANQIAHDTYIAPSSGFGANAANVMQENNLKGKVKPVLLPRLAAEPGVWYMGCTDRAVKGIIYQSRIPPEFAYLNKPDDPNVFMQDKYLYGVRARGAAGYGPYYLLTRCET